MALVQKEVGRIVVIAALLLLGGCNGGDGGGSSSPASSPAQTSGQASLSWDAPQSNTDGSTLSDLSGFVILYGTGPVDLSQSIEISNPSVDRYVIENLNPGTWYFAVQAVNAAGVRSSMSEVASTIIT